MVASGIKDLSDIGENFMRLIAKCTALAALGLVALPLAAQQSVPMNNGTPVAPEGVPVPPLPKGPIEYRTAEGQDIRVVVVARGLSNAWSIAFLPDGAMLVTERNAGRLLNENMEELRRESLLADLRHRVRDVRQGS
jgi:glucose/arabinose dehydrogenase